MNLKRLLFATAVLFLWSPAPVPAHQPVSAEFDINKPVTLKGTLTKMEWTNPHGWIYLAVKNNPTAKL